MNWDEKKFTKRQQVIIDALQDGREVDLDVLEDLMNINIEKGMSRQGVISCIKSLSARLVQSESNPRRIVRVRKKALTGRGNRAVYRMEKIL